MSDSIQSYYQKENNDAQEKELFLSVERILRSSRYLTDKEERKNKTLALKYLSNGLDERETESVLSNRMRKEIEQVYLRNDCRVVEKHRDEMINSTFENVVRIYKFKDNNPVHFDVLFGQVWCRRIIFFEVQLLLEIRSVSNGKDIRNSLRAQAISVLLSGKSDGWDLESPVIKKMKSDCDAIIANNEMRWSKQEADDIIPETCLAIIDGYDPNRKRIGYIGFEKYFNYVWKRRKYDIFNGKCKDLPSDEELIGVAAASGSMFDSHSETRNMIMNKRILEAFIPIFFEIENLRTKAKKSYEYWKLFYTDYASMIMHDGVDGSFCHEEEAFRPFNYDFLDTYMLDKCRTVMEIHMSGLKKNKVFGIVQQTEDEEVKMPLPELVYCYYYHECLNDKGTNNQILHRLQEPKMEFRKKIWEKLDGLINVRLAK